MSDHFDTLDMKDLKDFYNSGNYFYMGKLCR